MVQITIPTHERQTLSKTPKPDQACSPKGGAPATNPNAPRRKLQKTKNIHADQPATKPATPYHIHMLPLLYRCGWTELTFRNDLCNVTERIV
jgi:hypothetical protein